MGNKVYGRGIVFLSCVLGVAGGIAYAGIPDTGGTIHGCYKTGKGWSQASLRVINNEGGQACSSGEAAAVAGLLLARLIVRGGGGGVSHAGAAPWLPHRDGRDRGTPSAERT